MPFAKREYMREYHRKYLLDPTRRALNSARASAWNRANPERRRAIAARHYAKHRDTILVRHARHDATVQVQLAQAQRHGKRAEANLLNRISNLEATLHGS